MSRRCNDWKRSRSGVYYDEKNDHLVLLEWVGCRFYLSAEFDDAGMRAYSRPYPNLKRAGLVYVGEYYE